MKQILVIDDDIHIGTLLEEALSREGYGVSRAYSGTEALLDLMLPGLSGEELLPKITGVPVIVVSAKVDVDHKVELLLGGAVDYVEKPFVLRELLARIAVRLRDSAPPAGERLRAGALRLDTAARCVTVGEETVHLTRTEYAILKLLMQSPKQVVTKSALLERISLDTPDCTESSLKTHMSNLRKKLRDAGAGDPIEAVWGIGFKMRAEMDEILSKSEPLS